MKIYKYELPLKEANIIDIPEGPHKIVHVAEIHRYGMFVWILVSDSENTKELKLIIKGTGHNVEDNLTNQHRGTVVTESGYVWHVFEEGENEQGRD